MTAEAEVYALCAKLLIDYAPHACQLDKHTSSALLVFGIMHILPFELVCSQLQICGTLEHASRTDLGFSQQLMDQRQAS